MTARTLRSGIARSHNTVEVFPRRFDSFECVFQVVRSVAKTLVSKCSLNILCHSGPAMFFERPTDFYKKITGISNSNV